jgi:hypothetical protein
MKMCGIVPARFATATGYLVQGAWFVGLAIPDRRACSGERPRNGADAYGNLL